MSTEQNKDDEVFDINRVRELIELMKEHELNEIDLQNEPRRIRLKRGMGASPYSFAAPMPMAPAAQGAAPAAPESSEAPQEDGNFAYINSPMVGTFYNKPKPDEPVYVKVGDHVEPETIVCLVEAMKMFNEIPAGISGKVVEVCAKNESAVDVNKPLFKVAI